MSRNLIVGSGSNQGGEFETVSSNQQNQVPILSLVKQGGSPTPAPDDVAGAYDRTLDWSICMARAQDGDRQAYRRLLEEIAPFILNAQTINDALV